MTGSRAAAPLHGIRAPSRDTAGVRRRWHLVACALAAAATALASAAALARRPCHEGSVRLLDPVPVVVVLAGLLTVGCAGLLVRRRPPRAPSAGTWVLLAVAGAVALLAVAVLHSSVVDPSGGCWSAF